MRNNERRLQTRRRNRIRHARRKRQKLIGFCLFVAVLIIAILMVLQFRRTHFSRGTTINNVDVSWLTIDQSYDKLNEQLCNHTIDFFFEGTNYNYFGDYFDLRLDSTDELEQFKSSQMSNRKLKSFYLSSLSLNEGKLKEVMYGFSFLDEINMTYPQSAYVILSKEDLLTIVPEKKGTYIDFDKAYEFALERVKSVTNKIDFASVASSQPEVTAEVLQESVDDINSILETSITFNINENSSLTLDKSVMKNWLFSDCNGSYDIDIDSNLPIFIQQLAETSATVNFEFDATGIGLVTVPAKDLPLDENAMISLIKSELGTAQSYTHTPVYDISVGDSYVEIDVARQHVWMYKDGKCVVDTDCVTGTAGKHDTPPGYFFLTAKVPGKTLRGYNDDGSQYAAPVSYWMPFNGGIGLHDAKWRATFGGTIYITNGSHGCVNLPTSAAKTIFENIDMSIPIIVYSSIIK